MKRIIMMSCTFLVIGAIINGISLTIKSQFLCKFLEQNLILLLVALLAVNTTTISVILTKMREIADNNPTIDFGDTKKAMQQSSIEHLFLIGIAVFLQILKGSPVVCSSFQYTGFVLDSLIIAIFIFSIQIVYDTAQSVYVILDHGH